MSPTAGELRESSVREYVRTRFHSSEAPLGVLLDPDGAILGVFLLPDRHDRLELVNRCTRRGERGIAVGSGRGYDDGDVADAEIADAVMHRDAERTVLAH